LIQTIVHMLKKQKQAHMSTFSIIYYFIRDVGKWDYSSYFLSIRTMVTVRSQGLRVKPGLR